MQELDQQSDPYGRYRINAFFCRDTSWQATMRLLAMESDVILMDIRSFSPQNCGCVYELEQLLNIADLGRTVFFVGELSDRTFLEKTLSDLWERVPPDSPNLKTPTPTVCLFSPQGDISHSLPGLLHLLLSKCR